MKHLTAYRVLISRNDPSVPTATHSQYLAIVHAFDLAGARLEAEAMVTSLHSHFDVLDVRDNATPYVRPRTA